MVTILSSHLAQSQDHVPPRRLCILRILISPYHARPGMGCTKGIPVWMRNRAGSACEEVQQAQAAAAHRSCSRKPWLLQRKDLNERTLNARIEARHGQIRKCLSNEAGIQSFHYKSTKGISMLCEVILYFVSLVPLVDAI